MSPISFALASSLVLGFSDFAAAHLLRRFAVAKVAFISQLSGLILVSILAFFGAIGAESFRIGLLAGVLQAIAVFAFYSALAKGTVSVISPIVATSAIIPFLLAVAGGEQPRSLGILGAAFAVAGIFLVSGPERLRGGVRSSAIILGLATAGTHGVYLYVFGLASKAGDSLSAVLGVRLASFGLIAITIGFVGREAISRGGLLHICLYGVIATGNAILLSLAFEAGLISLVSVLASTYPLVTIGLSRVFLNERLTLMQGTGAALAVIGVALTTLA